MIGMQIKITLSLAFLTYQIGKIPSLRVYSVGKSDRNRLSHTLPADGVENSIEYVEGIWQQLAKSFVHLPFDPQIHL